MILGPVNCALTFQFANGKGFAMATCSNTYIVDSTTPLGPELVAETNNALQAKFSLLAGLLGQYASLVGCHYRPLGGATFPDTFDEFTPATGTYLEHAPFNQTILVQKFVGDEWNTYKGRAYIPFIGAPLGNKPFVPGFDTDLQDYADLFAATLTDGGTTMIPVIYNRVSATATPIVKCKISQFLAFQRKRNASRRYYEFP